jgi:ATP-dependent HslUV protease ATP-binding subunit HslU
MVGPTGCGKTEIARRLAKLSGAPFIKVEATSYTEVGFHGKDVDQIIKDLVDLAIANEKKKRRDRIQAKVKKAAEEKIIKLLVGDASPALAANLTEKLRAGYLDNRMIDIEVPNPPMEMKVQGQSVSFEGIGELGRPRTKRKRMKVSDALPLIENQEADKLIDNDDVVQVALKVCSLRFVRAVRFRSSLQSAEEDAIVFIDEIDKLCDQHNSHRSADASSEGVQKDLLPILEGSTIQTKHGPINTNKMLFIASGAFHTVKPSDLISELQGRLPIRVQLNALTTEDFYRILKEPVNNHIRQQVELLKVEGIELIFNDSALWEIAKSSSTLNSILENLGARRLHSVIEMIVEELSFECKTGSKIVFTENEIRAKLAPVLQKQDLTKYIL